MAHLLKQLGEAALKLRYVEGLRRPLPALISARQAAELRKQYLAEGKEWPYEHIYPGIRKDDPPFQGGKQKGHKSNKAEMQRRIEENMARMPELIAAYRASRKVPWDQVSAFDRVLMTRKEIKETYVRKKLK